MSVWLTPDLKPFIGGTYFPPRDHGRRPGLKTVLTRIMEQVKSLFFCGGCRHQTGLEVARQQHRMFQHCSP